MRHGGASGMACRADAADVLPLSPLITLTAFAAAGIVVLAARIRSPVFSQDDSQPGAQQFNRGESEHRPDRVTEVGG